MWEKNTERQAAQAPRGDRRVGVQWWRGEAVARPRAAERYRGRVPYTPQPKLNRALTDHARHETANLVGDLEDVRHRGRVDQPILGE